MISSLKIRNSLTKITFWLSLELHATRKRIHKPITGLKIFTFMSNYRTFQSVAVNAGCLSNEPKNLYYGLSFQLMLFLTNEPAKKAEINILTARDTTGPGY